MAFKLTNGNAAQLNSILEKYESAREELFQWLTELHGEWEEEFSEKSERWQEGEAGAAAQERIDTLAAWLDELPEDCPINAGELL